MKELEKKMLVLHSGEDNYIKLEFLIRQDSVFLHQFCSCGQLRHWAFDHPHPPRVLFFTFLQPMFLMSRKL